MERNTSNKVFHLAITMAGAVSAGAYTAGVMDYLLEALEEWYQIKQEAADFFEAYPDLRDANWNEFTNAPQYQTLINSEENLDELKIRAARYNGVPQHEIKIEVLSGASAGGMTAAITSLVLQLKDKSPVKFLPDSDPATELKLESIKQNNRLFDSWVNLTSDDMLSELLSNDDIKIIGKPVSALNSTFIRTLADKALQITEAEDLQLPPYVARDFSLFMTLTNLQGYQKSLKIDPTGQRSGAGADDSNFGEFITYDHSDLIMFSFGDKPEKGNIQIDFDRKNDPQMQANIKLLGDAAIATGAFPIGLEYASFARQPAQINDNFLIKKIHSDTKKLVDDSKEYLTTFLDGGLINNEPFELTDWLLMDKLMKKMEKTWTTAQFDKFEKKFAESIKKNYPEGLTAIELEERRRQELDKWLEEDVLNRKNHSIVLIDPFPSEKKDETAQPPDHPQNYYPFSLLGVIGQLVSTIRSQLLVKPSTIKSARDENDFSCYLIAPRRRAYQRNRHGRLELDAKGKPVPLNETDNKGNLIPKYYEGSAAIACGTLWGFGGFLSKDFRSHDFYLGRINCQRFLRKHFKIKCDGENSIKNAVTEGYSEAAKQIFQKECEPDYVPIIPDITVLKAVTLLPAEEMPISPEEFYPKLTPPKYDMKIFKASQKEILNRIWLIISSLIQLNNLGFFAKNYIGLGFWMAKNSLFEKIYKIVRNELKDWDILK